MIKEAIMTEKEKAKQQINMIMMTAAQRVAKEYGVEVDIDLDNQTLDFKCENYAKSAQVAEALTRTFQT